MKLNSVCSFSANMHEAKFMPDNVGLSALQHIEVISWSLISMLCFSVTHLGANQQVRRPGLLLTSSPKLVTWYLGNFGWPRSIALIRSTCILRCMQMLKSAEITMWPSAFEIFHLSLMCVELLVCLSAKCNRPHGSTSVHSHLPKSLF